MTAAEPPSEARRWIRRVAWLVAIWTLSVGALTLVAFMLRGILQAVGLST